MCENGGKIVYIDAAKEAGHFLEEVHICFLFLLKKQETDVDYF